MTALTGRLTMARVAWLGIVRWWMERFVMALQSMLAPLEQAQPTHKAGGALWRRLWCLVAHRRHRWYIEDAADADQWASGCPKCGWEAGPLG